MPGQGGATLAEGVGGLLGLLLLACRPGNFKLPLLSSTFHPTEVSPPRRLNGEERPKSNLIYGSESELQIKERQNRDVKGSCNASIFEISFPLFRNSLVFDYKFK